MPKLKTIGYLTEVPRDMAMAIIDMSERYSGTHFNSRRNFPVSLKQTLSEIYLMGFFHAFEAIHSTDDDNDDDDGE